MKRCTADTRVESDVGLQAVLVHTVVKVLHNSRQGMKAA